VSSPTQCVNWETPVFRGRFGLARRTNRFPFGHLLALTIYEDRKSETPAASAIHASFGGREMQMAITFMAVVAGLIFSVAVAVAVAVLAEEVIFGQVFRLFFVQQPVRQMVRQTVPINTGQKR
jgi:hypothetical protein